MIKKKIIAKATTPTNKPTKKLVPKKQVEVEEEDSELAEESEEIDLEEDEAEEEPVPAAKKKTTVLKGKPSKKNAIADAFNAASAVDMEISEGEHVAILYKLEGGQSNDGRPYVRQHYAICEEMEGDNTITGIYMMKDNAGKPAWTVRAFELMCKKIGMELVRPITSDDLDAVYEFVEENKPGCVIKVSYVNGRALANFVDVAEETEELENWRDSIQF